MQRLFNLLCELNVEMAAFIKDAESDLEGNKFAGVKARQTSLKIEALLHEYRNNSLKNNTNGTMV